MTVLAWLSDPIDYRVIAALARKCGVCSAPPGEHCGWPWGKPATGIIHQIRVPLALISEATDHLSAEKVR